MLDFLNLIQFEVKEHFQNLHLDCIVQILHIGHSHENRHKDKLLCC